MTVVGKAVGGHVSDEVGKLPTVVGGFNWKEPSRGFMLWCSVQGMSKESCKCARVAQMLCLRPAVRENGWELDTLGFVRQHVKLLWTRLESSVGCWAGGFKWLMSMRWMKVHQRMWMLPAPSQL